MPEPTPPARWTGPGSNGGPAPKRAAAAGPVALVVDDIGMMRDLLGRMLRALGFAEVIGAGSADAALAALTSGRRIDVALVDWNLSGIAAGAPGPASGAATGGELVRRLRAERPGLPILMVTGETEQRTVLAARDAGVDAYLVKPVAKADLAARVKFALQKRGAPPLPPAATGG
jgi:CheY-like chemotaxis protein